MPITHIVLFGFRATATPRQIEDTCSRMIGLANTCIHPTTQKPYVKSLGGGRDNSPEGLQGGLTHGFICEFANEDDRRYYLEKDPSHLAFVASLKDVVEQVRVLDFEPGRF